MKLTLPALSLALLTLGLPAWAQTTPAAKAKTAVETAADKAGAATDKAAEKAGAATDKAADKAKESAKKATAPAKTLPFYGTVTAADETAKTVSLGETVYHVTETTVIHDGEKPAKFTDVKVGKKIGGSYITADGKKELVKLNVGVKQPVDKEKAKSETKEKAKPETKEKTKPAAPAAPAAPADATKKP